MTTNADVTCLLMW